MLLRAISLDTRSISLFRVGIGLAVLLSLSTYYGIYRELIVSYELVSLEMVARLDPVKSAVYHLPFRLAPGVLPWLLPPAIIAAAVAVMLGYRSRLACAACWLLMVLLQARNPTVTNFGDQILLVLLFWGAFLPLGSHFSLDRMQGRVARRSSTVEASIPTLAMLLQFSAIYFMPGILKTGPSWTEEMNAVWLVLAQKWRAAPLAELLLPYKALLDASTYLVRPLEMVLPLLLFSPFAQGPGAVGRGGRALGLSPGAGGVPGPRRVPAVRHSGLDGAAADGVLGRQDVGLRPGGAVDRASALQRCPAGGFLGLRRFRRRVAGRCGLDPGGPGPGLEAPSTG